MARPPIGIAILGFLALMAGFAYLIIGLMWVGAIVFGPIPSGQGVGLVGILAIIAGVIYFAVGIALWSLQPWAWVFAVIMSVFGLFEAVLVVFASDSVGAGLAAALFPGIVLWYLNTSEVKHLFLESPEPAGPAAASPPAAPESPVAAAPPAAAPPAAAPPAAAPPAPPAAEPPTDTPTGGSADRP
jgi:hypothetical protein